MGKLTWPQASWYGRGSWNEGAWFGLRLGAQPGTTSTPRMRFVDQTPSFWSDGSSMRWVI